MKQETPTKKDNIKSLFKKLKKKGVAIMAISDACGRSPNTVKMHWLSEAGLWSYPIQFEDVIIDILQKANKKEQEIPTT